MSAAHTPAGTHPAPATPTPSAGPGKHIGLLMIALAIVGAIMFYRSQYKEDVPSWTVTATTGIISAGDTSAVETAWCDNPKVIAGVTPATLNFNYAVSMRSEGPIKILYGDGQEHQHTNTVEGQQAPKPTSDQKTFVDPRDPKGGHVRFWLCPN